ncbi:metal ABC transporter substrate-binding protein [Fructilactobacillus lindneri]|uniref:Amino acid ABC transporter, substrate binding protein n=2 Tax=Fructilactobacillus lindneri TaxID=53444 RepID=A0A0R2JNW1_9LACO|nr:MetQ/NlpA family ABC transporter substrate-binding protein [Fructilactobacillus lindneri]ANZ57717.1 metal ABC transporter substrate-binding protein [Fructilactobacillus lindneri]ANZ58987.1 metal ABC transporter substrate-binding protein [Fructilactobacillus lindneri]KRN78847.1 amino acid ABC transporter, substrate binding protein [Fructilactobacillus lindneri DSM 20690 = JCM 11027]POG98012.1 metal ABC transporter substrate-binding protein [Fructilactobacillus lindneri]POG99090.1 metal ABC t
MKKFWKWAAGIVVVLAIGFGFYHTFIGNHQENNSSKTITIGSYGPDTEVWEHIAKLPETKKAGLNLKVQDFSDGVSLNKATLNGEVDVNAFQMYGYLKYFNNESKNGKLAPLGTTYLEPMGIYSKRYKSVKDLPKGATIAISSNPANTSRSLKLLQSAGLIKLKGKPNGGLYKPENVADNHKDLKFQEVDDHTGPRLLNDKNVAAVVIGNTMALQSHLNVKHDSIYHEKMDQSTKNNINVLATNEKNKNNPQYKKLVKLYHSKAAQDYINKKFKGTKIDVDKPVSYLEN